MSLPWTVLCLLALCGVSRGAEEEVGSPLRVAQCRAKCIYSFGKAGAGFDSCIRETDCFMCWEKCQLLESNFVVWGAVCSKPSLCGSGCQLACQFHRESSRQRVPVLVTQGQTVISRTGPLASWPQPPMYGGPHVFAVLVGPPWRQLQQTTELSARVPESASLRVLVVGRHGLVTIYSPHARRPGPDQEVLRMVGKEALLALRLPAPSGTRINTQLFTEPSQDPLDMLKDVDHGWNLRQLSLIHQRVLVIAEIGWNPQGSPAAAAYFVTWEVEGGGLRGNLFTDATSVTLSLWPDTVYHIQVELVRHDWKHGSQSEELVLDTHTRGARGHLVQDPGVVVLSPQAPHPRVTVLAGVLASLASFTLVLALFACRWWGCAPHAKVLQESAESSHIYRVYPPAVRLSPTPGGALEPIPSVSGATPATSS